MASARQLVEIFHGRPSYWHKRVRILLPSFLRVRGEMKKVGYLSDKYMEEGDEIGNQIEYIHDHEGGVKLYDGCHENDPDAIRAPRWPTEFACLGELWHVSFYDGLVGHVVEAVIPRGTWLLSAPNAKKLICLHPQKGFYGAIWGGKMFVGPDGIEG